MIIFFLKLNNYLFFNPPAMLFPTEPRQWHLRGPQGAVSKTTNSSNVLHPYSFFAFFINL